MTLSLSNFLEILNVIVTYAYCNNNSNNNNNGNNINYDNSNVIALEYFKDDTNCSQYVIEQF